MRVATTSVRLWVDAADAEEPLAHPPDDDHVVVGRHDTGRIEHDDRHRLERFVGRPHRQFERHDLLARRQRPNNRLFTDQTLHYNEIHDGTPRLARRT